MTNPGRMKRYGIIVAACLMLAGGISFAQNEPFSKGGATEKTASKSEYFTWIDHTWEGSTEEQTLANLNFYKWLKDTYGMQLDIYALDAGNIDGHNHYGWYKSGRTARNFPNGYAAIAELSRSMGTGLGMWAGPDGFGDTPEDAARRSGMFLDMVRNYNFRLLKLDACCGVLRPEKYAEFNSMMDSIRTIVPDFVVLNHRLDLGEGTAHSTTYLLGGRETYVDVQMRNEVTAPHHRAGNLARENTPGLTRLSEDHGVCFSSCLDAWDDDLVLQAFCRDLILAPEIYGSPQFLRDDEFPYLAYIFNLHRDYRDILVDGIELPEDQYGEYSVSRGDANTRFITVRNLSWETRSFRIDLDGSIGLEDNGRKVKARLYHPCILDSGDHAYGSSVEVSVAPFRVALIKLTNVPEKDNILISGVPYRIVNDRVGDVCSVKLLGEPGKDYDVRVTRGKAARQRFKVHFEGQELKMDPNRLIATLEECDIPDDMEAIFWATAYSQSSDCLEAQSIRRSGPTGIPAVQASRDAFFNQKVYHAREADSRYLFDGDKSTCFSHSLRDYEPRLADPGFLLDLGSVTKVDSLVFDFPDWFGMQPYNMDDGAYFYVSDDLKEWEECGFIPDLHTLLDCAGLGAFRYFRFSRSPIRVAEVKGYAGGFELDRSAWTASNSFMKYDGWYCHPRKAWSASFTLDEIPQDAYLCVAINGKCGINGALAGFRINGKPYGCPDRAPSYPCNEWEAGLSKTDRNVTYYLPLDAEMAGAQFDAVVMSVAEEEGCDDLDIKVYMSQYPWDKGGKEITVNRVSR